MRVVDRRHRDLMIGLDLLADTYSPNTSWDKILADMADRGDLSRAIDALRAGETAIRQLRQRMEALQAGTTRTCPTCGTPVTGRSDAVYCTTTSTCRVRAHRATKQATTTST